MSRANKPAMGIATDQTAANKRRYLQFLKSFEGGKIADIALAAANHFTETANINASHPINETTGGTGYVDSIIDPIMVALKGCTRHNYIVMGGAYQDTEWVTSTGYFHGHFTKELWGIPPSGKLAFLRFGEFHRIEAEQIVESHIYLGFAELIIALDLWPLAPSQGYEGGVPGPATQDGILADISDPVQSRASADLVEGMLKKLATEDEAWRPDWHERMVWYGPGGLGSYTTVDGFAAFQGPFEKTFEGWGDGKDMGISGVGADCKAGDGDYAFLSGWPMITGIHVRPFLGLAPTGKRVFMRDCDWWRYEDGKIVENWCMLDIPHVFLQFGYDLFDQIGKPAA